MEQLDYSKFPKAKISDEKYTPAYAVLPIIEYIPKDSIVWCPFDTDNSEYVIALKEAGFQVVCSHIFTGQDFFHYEPDYWDVIVSNPPFSGKRQIFERCLQFGKPFALLMSNLWLNDRAPNQLFKGKDLQLMIFDCRVHYNEFNRVSFGSSYFCYNFLPKQIILKDIKVDKNAKSRMFKDIEILIKKAEQ